MSPAHPVPRAKQADLPKWEKIRMLRAEAEYDAVKKDVRVAYALWCVVGLLGGHRFYLGDTARSLAMLFTFGGLGVWTLLDVFFIARRVRAVNRSRRASVMARYGILDDPDYA
ncbi:TM2 domain-containing protein [Actinoplanes sp. NPDC051475]|uniref:TM2 domain-containing protein n=1 Tax=Actinoplanes sp. NPDC051475 TaxID=3157225 RepID=UPI00344E7249